MDYLISHASIFDKLCSPRGLLFRGVVGAGKMDPKINEFDPLVYYNALF